MTNTKQAGDETESKVLAALISTGYSVSIPFGDNDKYDLVLDTGNELLRVQCKTGWVEGDVIRFKTASKTTEGGKVTTNGYGESIDAFAVRCKETEMLYWVPRDDAGKKSTYLRLAPPEIAHPGVKMAAEYQLDRQQF